MDASERLALATLCEELPELRAECARQSAARQALLARVESEAQARRPVLGLLAELLGTGPDGAVRALGTALPGSGPGQADEERFGCPDRACVRVAFTLPAGPAPRCRVTGEPMARS
ncbi:hypothetical protein FXF51_39970 [Nonomuraea sp. PA05]|uniref:hypothetical protein n=1 Tax=Nonomuraea sp. PA05 TaxID=2604466 RepID=UPI0011D51D4A|nr:hypothetical protein [Nonomuraea sp. PA05]TYB57674.1 hypothetical protein FXF51_39970 [Nonomuraea sp. PA05]